MTETTLGGFRTGGFPDFGPGDRIRLIRRRMLHRSQAELAAMIGVTTQALSAWEAGRNDGGITPAVALRLEMATGQPGTAAFILGVLPVSPGGPGLPRLDSNQKPPGLRHVA